MENLSDLLIMSESGAVSFAWLPVCFQQIFQNAVFYFIFFCGSLSSMVTISGLTLKESYHCRGNTPSYLTIKSTPESL